jgi:hypothetical protein
MRDPFDLSEPINYGYLERLAEKVRNNPFDVPDEPTPEPDDTRSREHQPDARKVKIGVLRGQLQSYEHAGSRGERLRWAKDLMQRTRSLWEWEQGLKK